MSSYLVTARDCNSDYLGLAKDADGGVHGASIEGDQALLELLTSTKTGWFPMEDAQPRRHRVIAFQVIRIGTGQAEQYLRTADGVINARTRQLVQTTPRTVTGVCECCGVTVTGPAGTVAQPDAYDRADLITGRTVRVIDVQRGGKGIAHAVPVS